LSGIKQTATGQDQIPFWVWKDFADIFAPVVSKCWNLSLRTSTWPDIWKKVNINPLPKTEIPTSNADYRGINITLVIARQFEKVVYRTFCKDTLENHLNSNQFAYRRGGNYTNALIKLQHSVLSALDDKTCKAVRVWTFLKPLIL